MRIEKTLVVTRDTELCSVFHSGDLEGFRYILCRECAQSCLDSTEHDSAF